MKSIYLFLFATLVSTSIYAQTPLEFNDKMADITDSLYTRGGAWSEKFNEVLPTGEFSQLAPHRIGIQKFIEKKIKELKVMKDVSGSEELRKATIDFLVFENKMITSAFKPFEKFNASTPKDTINAAITHLQADAEKEKDALKKMADAQERYAAKNDFKIESGKPEEEEAEEEPEE